MSRRARLVVPGIPHHITQRGNRRQQTFFREDDYDLYKDAMSHCCRTEGVAVWCYCLMPNHTHLIAVPPTSEALRRAVGEAHRSYTNHINQREGWSGFLWQGRFASFPLDPAHLHSCARYIERNPVRAGIVGAPEDWPHSSARAHLLRHDDILVRYGPLIERIGDWRSYLDMPDPPSLSLSLRQHMRTGQPFGEESFVVQVQGMLERMSTGEESGNIP